MNSTAEIIGRNIKAARKVAGISQTELAKRIGKSLRTVQGYESGETEPSIAMIHEIAKALGVTSSSLMGYERSGVRIKSYDDVLVALLEICELKELRMEIEVKRPPHFEEVSCSLKFYGQDHTAKFNSDLCIFLEELRDKRREYEGYWIDRESYDRWVDHALAYRADMPVTKRERPVLTREEELQFKKESINRELEAIQRAKEKAAGQSGDQKES